MTIVLDTNLWVSMLLGMQVRGLRRHLYDPRIHVVTSSEQRAELTTTLSKPKLTKVLTPADRDHLLGIYDDVANQTLIREYVQACRDPKDDFLLSVAIAGGAEAIVSGDKDLLELQSFRGIEILAYSEFEKRLAAR